MTFTDRTGWRYRSKRRGRIWNVSGLTPFGWRLWPEWTTPGTAGGVKPIIRPAQDLDDSHKWERLNAR